MQRIMTLYPASFQGRGPARTCDELLKGYTVNGAECNLYGNRILFGERSYRKFASIRFPLNRAPYRWIKKSASRRTEAEFLKNLKPGDIAYLWAGTTLELHYRAKERGAVIVQEALNSRMEYAKALLDKEYEDFGLKPNHGITQERIDHQNERYRISDAVFCPSPMTEDALVGFQTDMKILPSSYGMSFRPDLSFERPESAKVKFIFVGLGGFRKGIHYLLSLWPRLPDHYLLQIVGSLEDEIKTKFAKELSLDNVNFLGYRSDVPDLMSAADVFVFPSLEEGGPQVTYEAANAGLPVIATTAGGGRFLEACNSVVEVDCRAEGSLENAIRLLGASRDERLMRAEHGRRVVKNFDWLTVGRQRVSLLEELVTKRSRVQPLDCAATSLEFGAET